MLNLYSTLLTVFKILVLPQIASFDFGNEPINAMDMVSAYCSVNKGDLPMEIYWKFNGKRMLNVDGVSITRTNRRISVLSIESVHDYHSGNYTCTAENLAGIYHHTASLFVNGLALYGFF